MIDVAAVIGHVKIEGTRSKLDLLLSFGMATHNVVTGSSRG